MKQKNSLALAVIATIAASALTGCATQRQLSQSEIDEANAPLYCEGRDECDFMWRKAQVYVSTASGYKIQTATDSVIETYNAPAYSMTWAYKLTKAPIKPGKDRILMTPSCGPAPICQGGPMEMVQMFKRHMRGSND